MDDVEVQSVLPNPRSEFSVYAPTGKQFFRPGGAIEGDDGDIPSCSSCLIAGSIAERPDGSSGMAKVISAPARCVAIILFMEDTAGPPWLGSSPPISRNTFMAGLGGT